MRRERAGIRLRRQPYLERLGGLVAAFVEVAKLLRVHFQALVQPEHLVFAYLLRRPNVSNTILRTFAVNALTVYHSVVFSYHIRSLAVLALGL